MKKKYLLLLSGLLIFTNHLISQECEYYSDTVFMINFNIVEVGKSPNTGILIIDDLNKVLLNKENIENFVCTIFLNTQYLISPSFGFENNLLRYYADSSESVYDKAVDDYYQNVHDLYKRSYDINFFLNDNTKILFKFYKFYAEFWKIPLVEHGLNEFSDQVHISSECYNEPILYSIKAFKDIFKLSKSEKKCIKNKLKANSTF
jgi:hypothetical protein